MAAKFLCFRRRCTRYRTQNSRASCVGCTASPIMAEARLKLVTSALEQLAKAAIGRSLMFGSGVGQRKPPVRTCYGAHDSRSSGCPKRRTAGSAATGSKTHNTQGLPRGHTCQYMLSGCGLGECTARIPLLLREAQAESSRVTIIAPTHGSSGCAALQRSRRPHHNRHSQRPLPATEACSPPPAPGLTAAAAGSGLNRPPQCTSAAAARPRRYATIATASAQARPQT